VTDTVKLDVNGASLEIGAPATVSDLVEVVGCGSRGVAVAVNSELVRRTEWSAWRLNEGDKVEVLHAVAGG
jgi:sulfur carrier protein